MYTEYFQLSEEPFSIAANPRFLYLSEQHREALAHLHYGIRNDAGFVMLTGEVGCGRQLPGCALAIPAVVRAARASRAGVNRVIVVKCIAVPVVHEDHLLDLSIRNIRCRPNRVIAQSNRSVSTYSKRLAYPRHSH